MKDISAIRKEVYDLNKKRETAIGKVLQSKPFIAAQVYMRNRTCGNPNCKCGKGETHGPDLWIYQNIKGSKIVSMTVKNKKMEAKEFADRYVKLRELRKLIRAYDKEINTKMNELEEILEKEIDEYVKIP